MRKIKIKIQADEDKTFVLEPMKVELPEYKTKDSAGCDLTNNGEAVTILSEAAAKEAKEESKEDTSSERILVIPTNECGLSAYSDDEIARELHRRGYYGNIYKTIILGEA